MAARAWRGVSSSECSASPRSSAVTSAPAPASALMPTPTPTPGTTNSGSSNGLGITNVNCEHVAPNSSRNGWSLSTTTNESLPAEATRPNCWALPEPCTGALRK